MLVVVAHPDDETFGMGGTLAFYGHQGAEIHLVCATRGEAGDVPAEMLADGRSIGELREQELKCAAGTLDVRKLYFLNYRDSGMAGSEDNSHHNAFINVPLEKAAAEIALLIRKIRPDIVLTFDPNGGYFHPDHIAAHKATVSAFALSSNPGFEGQGLEPYQPKKMFFHIVPSAFIRIIVRLMPLFGMDPSRFGKNKDIDLTALLSENFPIHAKINYRRYSKLREMASACYASQGGDKQSGFLITWIMRFLQPVEMYMRAYPKVMDKRIKKELYSGIL